MLRGHDQSDQGKEQDIREQADRFDDPPGQPGRRVVDAQARTPGAATG